MTTFTRREYDELILVQDLQTIPSKQGKQNVTGTKTPNARRPETRSAAKKSPKVR